MEKKPELKFWRTVFSEQGRPSSKRVLGAFMIIVCLGILIGFSIKEGCTDNIKDLMELILILASSLLGISSITGIWKNRGVNAKISKTEEEEEDKEE